MLAGIQALAMPGGSKYTSAYGWSTNPKAVWGAAKAKALSCLDEEDPKLTALELAFGEGCGDWQTELAHPSKPRTMINVVACTCFSKGVTWIEDYPKKEARRTANVYPVRALSFITQRLSEELQEAWRDVYRPTMIRELKTPGNKGTEVVMKEAAGGDPPDLGSIQNGRHHRHPFHEMV